MLVIFIIFCIMVIISIILLLLCAYLAPTIKSFIKDVYTWISVILIFGCIMAAKESYNIFITNVQTEAIDCYNTGNYQYIERIEGGEVVDHYYKIYPPDYD